MTVKKLEEYLVKQVVFKVFEAAFDFHRQMTDMCRVRELRTVIVLYNFSDIIINIL